MFSVAEKIFFRNRVYATKADEEKKRRVWQWSLINLPIQLCHQDSLKVTIKTKRVYESYVACVICSSQSWQDSEIITWQWFHLGTHYSLPSTADAVDVDLNPGSRKTPWRIFRQPASCSCLENPVDRGLTTQPMEFAESDTTEQLDFYAHYIRHALNRKAIWFQLGVWDFRPPSFVAVDLAFVLILCCL